MARPGNNTKRAPARAKQVSPLGDDAEVGARRRSARSAEYREQQAQRNPWETLARIVIRRRLELGLSQQDVADRMGTSHSAISRIESGLHPSKPETLARLADALEMRYVHGFEFETGAKTPELELVHV